MGEKGEFSHNCNNNFRIPVCLTMIKKKNMTYMKKTIKYSEREKKLKKLEMLHFKI